MLTHPMPLVAVCRAVLPRVIALVFAAAACAVRADDVPRTGGPYVPTPQEVVERMLDFAAVGPQDFVIDLGSGDGRLVLTAAQRHGARGLGVDLDGELVADSTAAAEKLGVADRVSFRVEDVTRTPLAQASVITLYLLPGITNLLKPRFLAELAPGARIVSHDFDLGDWKADRQVVVDVKEKYGAPGSWKSTLFLWTVPAGVAGMWQAAGGAPEDERMLLRITQRYQEFEGDFMWRGASAPITEGRLEGTKLRFRLAGPGDVAAVVEARVEDGRMTGTLERGGRRFPWRAQRVGD